MCLAVLNGMREQQSVDLYLRKHIAFATITCNLGEISRAWGDPGLAYALYQFNLEHWDPNDQALVRLHKAAAECAALTGQKELAIQHCLKAVELVTKFPVLFRTEPSTIASLGSLLAEQQGQFAHASDLLVRLTVESPQYQWWTVLGKVRLRQSEFAGAAAAFEQAVRLYPGAETETANTVNGLRLLLNDFMDATTGCESSYDASHLLSSFDIHRISYFASNTSSTEEPILEDKLTRWYERHGNFNKALEVLEAMLPRLVSKKKWPAFRQISLEQISLFLSHNKIAEAQTLSERAISLSQIAPVQWRVGYQETIFPFINSYLKNNDIGGQSNTRRRYLRGRTCLWSIVSGRCMH